MPQANDPLFLAYLGQLKSQLDRIEIEMTRTDERFDQIQKSAIALEHRITALETWKEAVAQQSTASRWWVGAVMGAIALIADFLVLVWR
ncbi:MAG: hypothetical protein ACREB9_07540 [Thermoplasmata archaeon]